MLMSLSECFFVCFTPLCVYKHVVVNNTVMASKVLYLLRMASS